MERKKEEGEGRDFPGSPVAKTSLSNAEGPGLIPGGGAKIYMPPGQKTKTETVL